MIRETGGSCQFHVCISKFRPEADAVIITEYAKFHGIQNQSCNCKITSLYPKSSSH